MGIDLQYIKGVVIRDETTICYDVVYIFMIMNCDHPRWDEFLGRLSGPEGCDFRENDQFNCCNDHTSAIKIMKNMGFDQQDIEQSCDYFLKNGAYCDCEILFNLTEED